MSPQPNERAIRLLHLPKTAGTTLSSSLVRHYGRRQTFAIGANFQQNRANYERLSDLKRRSIHLFIGHSTFDTGISEADQAKIVTMLREPVSRVKSFIRYVAAGKTAHGVYDSQAPFQVDEFLESGATELSNIQVKHLISRHDRYWDVCLRELGDETSVNLAMDRLFQHVHSFGIQERFDESWVALWRSLNLKPPVYATMNRRNQHFAFTPEQEEKIRALNQLDIALYHSAKEEFERRLREGIISPQQLEEFRRRQQRWGAPLTTFWNSSKFIYRTYTRNRRKILSRFKRA